MGHDQWQRVGLGRPRVDEMHVLAVDRRGELIERIEAGLVCAPVVVIGPVVDQLLQVGHVGAEVPTGAGYLIGETGIEEPLPEIGQLGVGDRDTEGADVHGGRVIGRRIGCLVRCPRDFGFACTHGPRR